MMHVHMPAAQRARVSGKKACEAFERVQAKANAINEELDELTNPGGVPKVELDPDDSMVIVFEHAIAANKRPG